MHAVWTFAVALLKPQLQMRHCARENCCPVLFVFFLRGAKGFDGGRGVLTCECRVRVAGVGTLGGSVT